MSEKRNKQPDRISLRQTVEADLDYVIKLERAPENAQFIRQWTIQQHKSALTDDNIAHLIVEYANNKAIGYIILIGLQNPDQSIELKRIVIEEKNKGFGKKTLQLIEKLTFENLNAHRLWLEVIEHNERAVKLYESEGFVPEGMHRESLKQKERFISLKVMSILAQEYDRKGSR